MNQARERWSGRIGFMLATVGSAVGIGSIWTFPYEVGANGGSAFVAFYVSAWLWLSCRSCSPNSRSDTAVAAIRSRASPQSRIARLRAADLTSSILLPVGGLAIAVFAGWAVPERMLAEQLGLGPRGGRILRIILRYVAPAAIAASAGSAVFRQA